MILLIDTSTSVCHLEIYRDNKNVFKDDWQADRTLAEHLYRYLEDNFSLCGGTFRDISGIGVFKGPGSFTGLRVSAAVCNTLASELSIPIVGVLGAEWKNEAIKRLQNNETDELIVPFYGRDARITTPQK